MNQWVYAGFWWKCESYKLPCTFLLRDGSSCHTCFWCLVVTQTVPISLYMDICIFNFKVRPQCLWSPRLNIVRSSWAVSSFSLLSERQVEQRGGGAGGRDNAQSWINHPSTFDPYEAGGCFCTSAPPPHPHPHLIHFLLYMTGQSGSISSALDDWDQHPGTQK